MRLMVPGPNTLNYEYNVREGRSAQRAVACHARAEIGLSKIARVSYPPCIYYYIIYYYLGLNQLNNHTTHSHISPKPTPLANNIPVAPMAVFVLSSIFYFTIIKRR